MMSGKPLKDRRRGKTSRSLVAAAFSLKAHEKDFSRRRRERRRLGHGFSRQCEKPQFEVRRSRTAAVGITHVSPFAKDFCERDKNIVRKQGFPAPAPRICANLRLGGKGECGDVKMKALKRSPQRENEPQPCRGGVFPESSRKRFFSAAQGKTPPRARFFTAM